MSSKHVTNNIKSKEHSVFQSGLLLLVFGNMNLHILYFIPSTMISLILFFINLKWFKFYLCKQFIVVIDLQIMNLSTFHIQIVVIHLSFLLIIILLLYTIIFIKCSVIFILFIQLFQLLLNYFKFTQLYHCFKYQLLIIDLFQNSYWYLKGSKIVFRYLYLFYQDICYKYFEMGCFQSRNEKLIEEQKEQAAMNEQDKNNNLDLVSCSCSESAISQNKSTKKVSIEECRNSFNKSIDLMEEVNKKLEAFSGNDSDLSDSELN
ncbi:unnamed protein product (macronuclear) [Paramecium tetraurelia]|uniref:Transmembrane protein n=1 Tax=Paramecium tetraurelia TaxID=5888 RepID=A0DEZ8_PARTE|nr:uncharacterized protein GSPATT00016441001 [Paramecium tetraurelia]CAK81615.1 unnamed protein product [Paramecium tetraurelia]|eukprot:XP_001449012.1 hypothetical protein (macronuclear) [Paramecium tetraurelia strain d4-2]